MKVLLVSGPAVGGIRVHLWQIMTRLPAHGFEAMLAAPPDLPAPPGSSRADLSLGERLHPLRDLKQVARLSALRNSWRPDLVHAHGYKAALIASVAGVRPLVLTFHNLWPERAGAPARLGLRWAVRESDRQVAVSKAVLASVQAAAGPLRQASILPNPVEAEHFAALPPRAAARRELGLPAGALVVGFAGRLTPVKGPQVLLAAAARLAEDFPGLAVVLAGEGPDRGDLEEQARNLGLAGRAHFPGVLPDLRLLFAAADAWAIPSLAEGGGIVALEAMAAGLTLVASATGGLLESVTDGASGLLVPPGDTGALADALRRLLQDRELAGRLAAGAREAARRAIGPEEAVRRLALLYRSLLPPEPSG
jgi:glycosyltransferase involved in cell wall biosynthesis